VDWGGHGLGARLGHGLGGVGQLVHLHGDADPIVQRAANLDLVDDPTVLVVGRGGRPERGRNRGGLPGSSPAFL